MFSSVRDYRRKPVQETREDVPKIESAEPGEGLKAEQEMSEQREEQEAREVQESREEQPSLEWNE